MAIVRVSRRGENLLLMRHFFGVGFSTTYPGLFDATTSKAGNKKVLDIRIRLVRDLAHLDPICQRHIIRRKFLGLAVKRHWLDGPRWSWLCRVVGHQLNWRHRYVGAGDIVGSIMAKALGLSVSGPTPSWHYHGAHSMAGRICGRCGKTLNVAGVVVLDTSLY